MPGSSARRSSARRRRTSSAQRTQSQKSVAQEREVRRPAAPLQNVVMSALVALGCWGFAITFVFLTQDPNRYLFGSLAGLLALMWTVNFVVRFRKWRRGR